MFRTDSSSTIGTGHIMRDLVLASQYKDSNIIFTTQDLDGNINDRIKEAGYKVELLKSNSLKEVIELVEKYNIDLVVIDHYSIDYEYEKKLKKKTGVKILSFDDTYEEHYCDILLNHNISANKKRYKGLVPENCELRCGSKYTLIREEFIKEKKRKKVNKNGKTIFVAMGGSDHSNITLQILKSITKRYNVIVVTTIANKNLRKIKQFVLLNNKIQLYIDSNNIAKIMNNSDMAIISPSVISHEVLYMQLPFISILTGIDQKDIYKYFKSKKLITMNKFNRNKLKTNIKKLDKNLNFYTKIIKRMSKDG